MSNHIGERIREHMERKNWGVSEFARKANIPLPSMKDYLAGKAKPGADALTSIADTLEIAVDDLLFGRLKTATDALFQFVTRRSTVPEEAQREMHQVAFHAMLDIDGLEKKFGERFPVHVKSDGFVVPKLAAKAQAGKGKAAFDESVFVDVMAFKSDWLERRLGLTPGECALVEVQGDSMASTLFDGDVVLIDTRSQVVEDSGVFVFAQRSKVRVKRIQRRMNGSLKIISDNPVYEAEELTPKEADDFRVIGRVVWPRLK